jgi:uracil-DNA glycosylase family 4
MQFDLFNSPRRFGSVAELVKALSGLTDDPLAAAGTRMVVYRGSVHAPLMVVGEAPGAEEDRLGVPFVGPSGQLLDQILRSAGIDPERDVFVTNVAFRRPPGNRRPTSEEIAYYRPYLMELVRLVDPLVLMLAGAAAVEAVLEDRRPMSRIRGEWFPWNGRLAMPVFHPAYLLRNPSREPGSPKSEMWADIQEVRRRLVEEGALRGPAAG